MKCRPRKWYRGKVKWDARNLEDAALFRLVLGDNGLGGEDGAGGISFVYCDSVYHSPNRLIKYALQVPLRQCRAFQVLMSPDITRDRQGLLVGHRGHAFGRQRVERDLIFTEIELCADQDDGHARGVVLNLGMPFGLDVVEGRRRHDAEADEEDVGLGIGKGPKSIVIFLPRRIPKTQADGFAIDHDVGGVVIEAGKELVVSWSTGQGAYTVGMYSPGKALVV